MSSTVTNATTTAPTLTTSRRRFTKFLLAGAAATAVPVMPSALASPSFERFDISSATGVRVLLTAGNRSQLTVVDDNGNVLEQHKHLKGGDIFTLRSPYFTVRPLREVDQP